MNFPRFDQRYIKDIDIGYMATRGCGQEWYMINYNIANIKIAYI